MTLNNVNDVLFDDDLHFLHPLVGQDTWAFQSDATI